MTINTRMLTARELNRIIAIVSKAKRRALTDSRRDMTYAEAAEAYGYAYGSIRKLVYKGRIEAYGPHTARRITHQAMQDYLRSKLSPGRGKVAEQE